MSACLQFSKLSLAFLMCIVFQSCSKDTDLISEYVIRDMKQTEISPELSSDENSSIAPSEIAQALNVSKPLN